MTIPSSSDRETLQQLLANAFAVQESQINARCLSEIMEVQRAVRSGKLGLDGAMRHIVESARTVANATGVAIALIDGDHLRYRAGSGSSAVCIGWRVAASLTSSATTRTNREILRVEDAQTDTRIEADICRQFGANSLLILPIYFEGAVAGVLDVRFSEPHVFQDPEVRTYRLMAEQIEAALSLPAQQEPQENLAAELPPRPEFFEPVPADGATFVSPADANFALPPVENYEDFENFVAPPDFTMLPENEHSLYARCGAVLADIMKLPVFKQSVWLASLLTRQAKHIHLPSRPRRSAPAASSSLSSVFKRPTLIATTPAPRARTSTWPGRWLRSSLDAARNLSSSFKRSTSRAAVFAQRVKNSSWPDRWRQSSLSVTRDLSSSFKRSALRATVLAQRAKNLTWPHHWRQSFLGVARDVSSSFKRSASRAAVYAQRIKNSSWPDRWRRSSLTAAKELSSALTRSASITATVAHRAKALIRLNERRRVAVEVIVIVLAFTALIAYRGRVPAKLLESSTQSTSSAIGQPEQQPEQQPKPLPGKSASQDPQASFDPRASLDSSPGESKHAGAALKQVRKGPNEVDYVADDVTMRVFTHKSAAKRSRPANTRVAEFGDDVTVHYFAPPPPSTKAATR
jgi:putative methionine-R-sulfoxide reductase with GAF domain